MCGRCELLLNGLGCVYAIILYVSVCIESFIAIRKRTLIYRTILGIVWMEYLQNRYCIHAIRTQDHKERHMRPVPGLAVAAAVIFSALMHYNMGPSECPQGDGYLADIGPHNTCRIKVSLGSQILTLSGKMDGRTPPTYLMNWGLREYALQLGTPLEVDGYKFELHEIEILGLPSIALRVTKLESTN